MPKLPEGSGIDWLIAAGVPQEEIAHLQEKERQWVEIRDCYEKAMGYNPLDWARLERLKRFLLTKTPEEIQTFAKWCRRDYSTFDSAKARLYPDMVSQLWPLAFPRDDNAQTFSSRLQKILDSIPKRQ